MKIKPSLCSDDNVAETYISTDLESQTQTEYNEQYDVQAEESLNFGHIRKLLYYLSRHHLETNDWKKLARFWGFTEDQIKGKWQVEHSSLN